MGVEHLQEIVAKLIAHGRSSDTPAALIQDGTTSNQIVITGTLENIFQKSEGIRPPAVLIVGEVVKLHEQIDWFDPESISLSIKDFQTEFIIL